MWVNISTNYVASCTVCTGLPDNTKVYTTVYCEWWHGRPCNVGHVTMLWMRFWFPCKCGSIYEAIMQHLVPCVQDYRWIQHCIPQLSLHDNMVNHAMWGMWACYELHFGWRCKGGLINVTNMQHLIPCVLVNQIIHQCLPRLTYNECVVSDAMYGM